MISIFYLYKIFITLIVKKIFKLSIHNNLFVCYNNASGGEKMFENIYPHKIPFIPQKDGKIFEDFKTKLRKYNIESINVYLSDSLAHINEEKNEEKVLYIMTKNALGIIPDDDIIISTWNATLEENKRSDLISHSLKVIFINSEAMALEKNIRDDKNKVYISKLVEKKLDHIKYLHLQLIRLDLLSMMKEVQCIYILQVTTSYLIQEKIMMLL